MQIKDVEEIVGKLSALLPEGVQGLKTDMEANFKAVLQNAFSQMDLVTREEFDVQTQVLSRTREKLVALEARLAEIETQFAETK